MARQSPPLFAFNRGEVSKIALARLDVAKMQLAAEVQVNWLPFVVGPMMVRPGLAYLGEIASDNPCALIDFVYSKSDTALFELTDSLMRVWINDVLVSRVSVSTTVADDHFAGGGSWSTVDSTSGATITIAGGTAQITLTARGGLARIKQTLTIAGGDQNKEHALRVVVVNGPVTIRVGSSDGLSDYMSSTAIDAGTHSLVFTPTSGNAYLQIETTNQPAVTLSQCSIEAAGVLTLPTPWVASNLSTVRWAQSGDIVYLAAYGIQPYKIERRGTRPGARGFSVVKYLTVNGPFLPGPTINATLTPSVEETSGTLTSDRPFFTSAHVGAQFQLFSLGQTNRTVLANAGYFTDPIRVTGIGNDRKFGWSISGTWVGTLTLQRSLVGPDSGFASVATATVNATYDQDDTATLNNVVAWYRVGFNTGDYTSGAPTVLFRTNSGGTSLTANGSASTTGGRYGVCRVLTYNSSTQVTISVLTPFSSLTPTLNWQQSAWDGTQGWPTSVAFHEGRLWWFSGTQIPIAGSQSNNYTGFAQFDVYGNTLGDSGAILESFGEGPSDSVNWGLALTRLLCGREQSTGSIRSSAFDTPLTPTNFSVKDCSQQGAARLPPIKVGTRGVFVQQAGSKVYELAWNPQLFDYNDRDLTRFNLNIGAQGFVDTAKATQPDTTIFMPRGDGQCACLLYDPNDEVEAWWRIMTLGVIENVRVLPNPSGSDDKVYFCVKRTVNGVTKRYLERLTLRSSNIGGATHLGLDSHVTYSGGATNTITLAHLPNTTVTVWADGAKIGTGTTDGSGILSPLPDGLNHSVIVAGLAGGTFTYDGAETSTITGLSAYNGIPGEFFADQQPSGSLTYVGTLTPSGGSVSLPNGWSATKVIAYFGFMAPFMSAKLGYGAQMGSPLTQTKKIDHVGLVMYDAGAQSITFGQRFDVMDALPLVEEGGDVASTTIWSEYDQSAIELPGEWTSDVRLCLLGQAPYPAKIGAAVVSVRTNEK